MKTPSPLNTGRAVSRSVPRGMPLCGFPKSLKCSWDFMGVAALFLKKERRCFQRRVVPPCRLTLKPWLLFCSVTSSFSFPSSSSASLFFCMFYPPFHLLFLSFALCTSFISSPPPPLSPPLSPPSLLPLFVFFLCHLSPPLPFRHIHIS